MNGAQVLVKCLKSEGTDVIFGYPGAAIAPFYDALGREGGLRHILVRQEQNAGHAASGYSRASGKTGVCCTTSGPGACNLITALATAYMDSIAMVAITGQVRSDLIGRDVFQEADITGACEPFTKNSYLVKNGADIPRIVKEAFFIASTGRPGPVLIDLPVDIQLAECGEPEYPREVSIIGYKPRTQGHPLQIKRAVELLETAQRPIIVAGGGVVSAQARIELIRFAERLDIPVVSTLMGVGIMPTEHRLYLGMLGTHGVAAANRAISGADLVMLCGARVGDRAMASPNQIAERASIIHIDIDPAEIGKNMRADIPIVGDVRSILRELTKKCSERRLPEWNSLSASWKAVYPRRQEGSDTVEPCAFVRLLSELASKKGKSILVADVGRNQIWSANNFRFLGGRFLTSGGMGTMGYSLPAAIGASLAKPERQVVAVCGDGSFFMMMNELSTAVQFEVPVKLVVMNNHSLGMIREVDDLGGEEQSFCTRLPEFVDIPLAARAMGAQAESISSGSETEGAIERMLESKGVYVLECIVSPLRSSGQEEGR